jgi:hypothetical protein
LPAAHLAGESARRRSEVRGVSSVPAVAGAPAIAPAGVDQG